MQILIFGWQEGQFEPQWANLHSKALDAALRLVFTSDRVVTSRSHKQKCRVIWSSENQTDGVGGRTLILLMTPSLTSKSKLHCRVYIGVASRSRRINQWQCSTPDLAIAISWFFHFCFRLWQPSFHCIISDGVVNGIGRNGNDWFFRLRFCWAYDSAYDSDFRFSVGHKVSYDSDYDSDSVASENQPQKALKNVRHLSMRMQVILDYLFSRRGFK